VPDRVLPRRELVPVIREPRHDELANAAQRELLVRRLQYGHGDQSYVTVRRFDGRPVTARGAGRGRPVRLVVAGQSFVSAVVIVAVGRGRGAAGGRVLVIFVVVGRVHVDVRRLGRTYAAGRRDARRRRVGHRGSGHTTASQIQRADELLVRGRVERRLVSATEIVYGQERGRCGAAAAAAAVGDGAAAAVAAAVAVAAVVLLHAGGTDHHAAHLTTISRMYDGRARRTVCGADEIRRERTRVNVNNGYGNYCDRNITPFIFTKTFCACVCVCVCNRKCKSACCVHTAAAVRITLTCGARFDH